MADVVRQADRTGDSSGAHRRRSSRRQTQRNRCAGARAWCRRESGLLPPPRRRARMRAPAAPALSSRPAMDAWPRCLERLEAELPAEDVHTWLKPLQVRRRDSGTVLYAPNAFVRDEVESRYLQRIRELLAHFGGSEIGRAHV